MKTLFEGKKLYAVIIAFLLIITFFITFHIIRNHYQYVVKGTIATNTLTANLLSTLMYEHQKAATSILESYARRPLFIDAVKKKGFHHVIPHLKSLSEHHTEIDALFITDQYGTLWADYRGGRESYGRNFAYRDWYKGVSKKWRPYISTLYQRVVLEKGLAVALSVPVFDTKGKVIGILGGAQRTPFLATFIKGNIIDPEKSTTLLDQEGNIIFSNTVPYEEKITKYPEVRVLEKALAGVVTNMEIADAKEKGIISYVSIAPVRGIGWSVIVGQEKNAILKPLYGYFIRSAATGFVIFLLISVSLLYFRREYKYRKTKELLQAEEKYHNIFNDAILGIYQTTPEGSFLSANPALARMYGYDTPEELINNVTDLATQSYINPEDREIFKRILLREGVVEKFETPLRKKGGETIWVSINAHTVKDTQGNISSFEGTIENITERKQAEEKLRDKSEEQVLLLDNIATQIWYLKDVETYGAVNSARAEFLGLEKKALENRSLYDVLGREEAEICIAGNREVFGGKAPIYTEEWINNGKGEARLLGIRKTPKISHGGNVEYVVCAAEDITERKQAEETLRASEENFRVVVENASDAILIATGGGSHVYENQQAAEITGYCVAELLKTTIQDLIHPDEREKIMEIYRRRLEGEPAPRLYETTIIRKDGKSVPIEVAGAKTVWQGKTADMVFFRDITERKRAEEERERLLTEIAAKNQELESFVYTISHDLRAPLVSLDGFSSLLKRESQNQLDEQGQHYLDRIRANVAHMNTLITELLELSRIGRVVGPEEEIDVGVLLREIEEGLVLKLEQEGVEFIVQQPLPAVRGDRGRIRQVFANLIENAVKFRSLERRLRIEVGCEEEKGFYRFHVGDNGIGILPQYQEQIFEPFRQLDSGIEGVGMGLALVKRIVEHHGGRVWVESEVGKGATFYFTIPRG